MVIKSARQRVASFFGALVAVFLPKTPRGRIRHRAALAVILFVFAGTLDYPRYWDNAVDWLNGRFKQVPALSQIALPYFWNVPFRLGLDLQGGTHLVYKADVKDVAESERAEALAGVRDVIERRVNAFGVAEPLVQTNKSGSDWQVVVDLAGIKDVREAIKLIGETPILEFKEQNAAAAPERQLTAEEKKDLDVFNARAAAKADQALKQALLPGADFAALAEQYSEDETTKNSGGSLGFVTSKSQYGPLIDLVVQSKSAVGQVLKKTAKLSDGIHIVKYDDRREAGQEIHAAHILICWEGAERCDNKRAKEEARALADKLKKEAMTANFAELAKQNSDDKGTAVAGGDLGWFGRGAMVPAFENAAFALGKEEISEVVESPFGFHLIYKTDERPAYEYGLSHIFVQTKTEADYLPPPSPWQNTSLSGKNLKRATLQFQPQTNEPQVGIEFDDEGKKLFADVTTRNVGKPVAIFLDGSPISTPTVQEPIRDGNAVISGNFTIQEAKLLVRRLNAGALPVPIVLESQQSVGASLGRDSLDASLKAGLIGFAIVALFMLLYYRLPGVIAILALVLYTVMNLALYKLIPVTLSLSGIAGFILSIGMAVDANVLIFERLKEEILRGRTLASATDEGFKRAWTSIRDSNTTTLISCVILFYTSSSLIKGFALTLGIGVLVSMFSAITVSRTLLRLVSGWRPLKRSWLYLPGLWREPKPNVETEH